MHARARASILALAATAILAPTSAAQELMRTYSGQLTVGKGLGQCVVSAGDLDHDGFPDLAVSYRQSSGALGTAAGAVQVFSGRTGAVLWTLMGTHTSDGFGKSLAAAGDLNSDGYGDLLVGIPNFDAFGADAGAAIVYSGRDGSQLLAFPGPFTRARFGWDVANLGDVNGDGRADLAVSGQPDAGIPKPAGFVRIFSGADGSLLREHAGANATSRLGCSIAAAGDVDGDSVGDLVAGDWRDSTLAVAAGAVRVFSGATGALLWTFRGDLAQDQLGQHVDGAGDLNGDGRADLLASSPFADGLLKDLGMVRAWSGADGHVLHTLRGDFPLDQFGGSIAGVGDVDADGDDDFLVGAFADDDGGTNSGRVRLYSGPDAAVVATYDGNSASDELGFAVAELGDVDGDKGLDFALAAPVDDSGGGVFSGSVRLYAGIPPPPVGPQNYCVTTPNSVGTGAVMSWSGSTSVSAADLVLRAEGAPRHTVGIFLASTTPAEVPIRGGVLCLAGAIQRLVPVVHSGPDGSFERELVPSRRGRATIPVQAGDTWCFQLLYVDQGRKACRAISFSDGLSVLFTP
jgi:FG-GAP repeat